MGQNTVIKQLDLADHDRILALWQASGLHSIRPQGRDSQESLAQQLAIGVQTILGLEVDGHLVGVVVATHDSRKGWINRLAVAPDHRRKGYAIQLIAAAEQALHQQGIHVIAALVEPGNTPSLNLLKKTGYTEYEPPIHYLSKRSSDAA